MVDQDAGDVRWQLAEVASPHSARPVAVVVARDIPYVPNANRYQNLSIYLPHTEQTSGLIGTAATSLPVAGTMSGAPDLHVHIHGGAWRDPELTSTSVEPAVAHAFSTTGDPSSIAAIASLNYTVSQFPTHPTLPYDAVADRHSDPAREAVHPQHVSDVLHGLGLLRSFGLTDHSYVLTGHSCGACLAFQAVLRPPRHYGLDNVLEAPCPAAVVGLNGLYDLPALVGGLGDAHAHLRDEYEMLLSNTFGGDETQWPAASPARFDPSRIAGRVRAGTAPRLVVLDQSPADQLVPMNQLERLQATLADADGLRVVQGHRCTGEHAAPWEQGTTLFESVKDTLSLLRRDLL